MEYSLYVDELGESVPKRYKNSPFFILTGCIVERTKRRDIIENLKHIKFKYWDKTDIVLHSVKIGRKEKDFSIFKGNRRLFNEFYRNLADFFDGCPLSIICVVVDLKDAYTQNWTQKTVISRSYKLLFENYVRFLLAKKSKGRFIQEASTPLQDLTIYEQFHRIRSSGIPQSKIVHKDVKSHLTGLSFITKKSNDSLSQLADLLGYGVKMYTIVEKRSKKVGELNLYQKMIRGRAKSKLLYIDPQAKASEDSTYKDFEAYNSLP